MNLFEQACENGEIALAKATYDWEYDLNHAFLIACNNNRFEVAQWLKSSEVNYAICINTDQKAFLVACLNGNYEMAQWLESIGVNYNHPEEKPHARAFQLACEYGQFKIAKWLFYDLGVDHHNRNGYAFRYSHKKDHFEIAQWLFFLDSFWHNKTLLKCQTNVFETTQESLIDMYNRLIIS